MPDCRLRFLLVASVSVLAGLSPIGAQIPQAIADRDAHLAQLAAEAAARGPVVPIPLFSDSQRALAAVYDQYLLGVVVGRQQIAAGQKADASAIGSHPLFRGHTTVVVAYPITCDGKPNRPLAIRWTLSRPLPVAPQAVGEAVRGNNADAILPGVGLPDDALVVNLRNALTVGATVEVDYADPFCHGAARTATMSLAISPSAGVSTAFNGIKLPAAFSTLPSPSVVRFRVILDSTGRLRFPEQVEGPAELGLIALDMLSSRNFPAALANGVPVPLNTIVPVVFTATGERAVIPPFVPPAPTAGPGSPMTMTTTVTTSAPSRSTTPPPVLPPAPPGQLETQLARLAVELGRKGAIAPVPLDAAGPSVHGVLFDRFLMTALRARAAMASGQIMDPASATGDMWTREDMITVAYPLQCGGRTVNPADVSMSSGGVRAGPLMEKSGLLSEKDLEARLPGVTLPSGSIGKAFAHAWYSVNLEVRVSYSDAVCSGDTKVATMPLQWVRGQSVGRRGTAKLPPNTTMPSPVAVDMRGLVDLDGAYRFPTVADGPDELRVSATVIASEWKWQPYRVNGMPTPQSVTTDLTFTTTGAEELDPAFTGVPAPAIPAPKILTSTTVAGRPETVTTADAPGLSPATSQCAIATTNTYGFHPATPIKVGGGSAIGPSRERQYLALLRGPSGQGLRMARAGSTQGPDGATILDVWEISYDGLTSPLRVFLDEYHDGTLQAPKGLVCNSPIVR
jgi:hypothetical protein